LAIGQRTMASLWNCTWGDVRSGSSRMAGHCLLAEGAIVLDRGRISKAMEGPSGDLGRCAKWVVKDGRSLFAGRETFWLEILGGP